MRFSFFAGLALFLCLACSSSFAQVLRDTDPETVLPVNLKSYSKSIQEQGQFRALIRQAQLGRSKDPLLYQANEALKELRQNPNDLRSRETLCEAYYRTGFMAASARECRTVLKIDPASAAARTTIAEIAIKYQKFDEAEKLLNGVLKDKPNYSRANLAMAEVKKAKGEPDAARANIEQASRQDPSAASFAAMGGLQSKSGELAAARDSYLRALQMDPQNAEAMANLSTIYASMGEANRAAEFARKAAETDPQSALAQYTLGTQYEKAGRLDEAAAQYARAVKLDSQFALAHRALGDVLSKRGSYIDALNAYGSAIRLNPKDVAAMEGQAQIYEKLNNPLAAQKARAGIPQQQAVTQQQAQAAIAVKAVPLNPQQMQKARSMEEKGNWEAARQIYETMAIENPTQPLPFYNMGRVYLKAQRYAEAKRMFEQSLSLDPNMSGSYAELSKIYCYEGDQAAAWNNYTKGVAAGYVDKDAATKNYLRNSCPSKQLLN